MFKKFLSVILSILLVVGLVACGGGSAANSLSDGDNGSLSLSVNSRGNGSLKNQISNAKSVVEYTSDSFVKNYQISEVGTVFFGSYPQSDSTGNTKDPIEWIVIEDDGSKALLLSKYVLDKIPYNTEEEDITWENCSLMKWLNNDFYNYAFSNGEKKNILKTNIVNSDNAQSGTKSGNNVKDKIFLLSIDEVKKYLINANLRTTTGTNYASRDWWWLRSSGGYKRAAYVDKNGNLNDYGDPVDGGNGIRTALWVKY